MVVNNLVIKSHQKVTGQHGFKNKPVLRQIESDYYYFEFHQNMIPTKVEHR